MLIKKKIRIVVVDDSLFLRTLISKMFADEDDIHIVALAKNATEAQQHIDKYNPDIVVSDIEMPGMNGLELVKTVMAKKPVKFIIMSSLSCSVFEVLQAGAVDFIRKPDMSDAENKERFKTSLITCIKQAAKANLKAAVSSSTAPQRTQNLTISSTGECDIIAIGASTGGTQTITEVLKDIPKNCPPIVIVQHMPPGYTKMFADRLNQLCKINVKEATSGRVLRPGTAVVAPGGVQSVVKKTSDGTYVISCRGEEKISGHCPSVDNLFESVAKVAGARSIGVLLTGMGRDGARGMLSMKKSGAYTIGQNKESSIVYGMPCEAYKLGAVTKQLPHTAIAEDIVNRLNKS